MRSIRQEDPGQLALWEADATDDVRRPRDRRRVELLVHEITGVEFASRGWHPGSILYYEPARRRERGQVVVMQRGESLRVGEYDIVWGRPVLRTDKGSSWLSPEWTLAGVVRMVEPPLIDFSGAVAG